jgi:hypothetical protein
MTDRPLVFDDFADKVGKDFTGGKELFPATVTYDPNGTRESQRYW